MQRAEMEELRQRDANLTALQAIGPRKKPKLESDTTTTTAVSTFPCGWWKVEGECWRKECCPIQYYLNVSDGWQYVGHERI